ncbi:hypothetical protein [Clostridium transplantifaecale]|uniref:hypothetical protein n=1 Tax=Clostridium transplantifaecale TaxID=2479838 RepID=UPI000F642092|nr:hypothetical protein [Clostridium transplantifaecale]
MEGNGRWSLNSSRQSNAAVPYGGFGDVDGKKRVVWVKTWEEAMDLLRKDHGEGTKAGIFSDGTIQYFA